MSDELKALVEPTKFSDGTPVPYVVTWYGRVIARCDNKDDADRITAALAAAERLELWGTDGLEQRLIALRDELAAIKARCGRVREDA